MKKLKNYKNNKGFTLVELIVVIVILAILAAILIPGLLKWIDEAKDKQYQLEARSIYMATQAEMAKSYDGTSSTDEVTYTKTANADVIGRIEELSALTVTNVTYTPDGKGGITKFETTFTSSDTNTVTMTWETNKQWAKKTTP